MNPHAELNRLLPWLAPAVAVVALHAVGAANYLLFHTLAEIARVVVLFGVFALAWHSRRWSNSAYIVFAGIAFLSVGFFELLHALAYKGMGVFARDDANLPTQLWIAARAVESVSLLLAPFVGGPRWRPRAVFLLYVVLTAALAGTIFAGAFPVCYAEGEGQTNFKIVAEYAISGAFLGAIVPLMRRRLFDTNIRQLLIGSLVMSALAEFTFTRYVSIYGGVNEAGHLLLLFSTYCLYRAVLVSGIVDPFSLLFQSLKDSEERYERLANAAKEGVLIYDDLRVVETNASFPRMFGYAPAEIANMALGDFFAVDGRREALVKLQGAQADAYETKGLRKDGSSFPLELSGSLITHRGREMRVAQLRDLTEEKRAEEERRALQAELARSARLTEIGRVAAALAHELNQPLTAVANYIGACRRVLSAGAFDDLKQQKLLNTFALATTQTLRAGEIIRRIREFIGSGQTERTVEVAASVLREATTLAMTAARHGAVTVACDFAVTGRILVNKVQIQQVIINLVANAVEAMEASERKELKIALASRADFVEVSVADTGSGLDPDMAERLFKPFSSTKTKGMGLGLSVCREIVEAHHGKIWVDANPGGGTVFRFTLPLVRDELIA